MVTRSWASTKNGGRWKSTTSRSSRTLRWPVRPRAPNGRRLTTFFVAVRLRQAGNLEDHDAMQPLRVEAETLPSGPKSRLRLTTDTSAKQPTGRSVCVTSVLKTETKALVHDCVPGLLPAPCPPIPSRFHGCSSRTRHDRHFILSLFRAANTLPCPFPEG